jgi:peptide/nickel transport system permease protein
MRRRLLQIVLLLPVLSLLGFALLHAVPGDPDALLFAGDPRVSEARLDALRARRGLERPVLERYGCWLIGRREEVCAWWPGGEGLLRGDLGWSRAHGRPVEALLGERLFRTLSLMAPAFVLAAGLALGLGTWAAARRGRGPDRVISAASLVGLATPTHWLSLLAVLAFGVGLGWLPVSGIEDPRSPGWASRIEHAALPVLVTAVFYAGRWLRFVRAAVAEALGSPFVLALRARGIPERQIARHALRSALVPIVTVIGHSLPGLVSGSVVIERVFAYPGMGTLLLDAVYADDHLVAVVVLLVLAAATLTAALVADAVLLALDPRLRAGGLR